MQRIFAIIALSFAVAGNASAGMITADGNGTDQGTDCTFGCVERYQQVYSSSLFSGITGITGVFFNRSDAFSISSGTTFDIYLSTAANGVNALSATFADNVGADVQLFQSGVDFGGSYAADEDYGFTGSFTYDSSQGDLLVDIIRTSGPSLILYSDYNSGANTNGEYSRVYQFSGTTTGSVGSDYGNHTNFTTSIVSGPGTLAILGLGLAGLGLFRRKR